MTGQAAKRATRTTGRARVITRDDTESTTQPPAATSRPIVQLGTNVSRSPSAFQAIGWRRPRTRQLLARRGLRLVMRGGKACGYVWDFLAHEAGPFMAAAVRVWGVEVPDCCAHLGSCDQQVPMPALY
jgi:hypothetical protein